MPKKIITSPTPYFKEPCDRCGSKKIISKTWNETIATFNGKSIIEHSQIVCIDSICQKAFDIKMLEEAKKREILKAGRLADAEARARLAKQPRA